MIAVFKGVMSCAFYGRRLARHEESQGRSGLQGEPRLQQVRLSCGDHGGLRLEDGRGVCGLRCARDGAPYRAVGLPRRDMESQ